MSPSTATKGDETEPTHRLAPGGRLAAAIAVAIAGAAVLALAGRPAFIPAHGRGNAVLAAGALVAAIWWAAAAAKTWRQPARLAAFFALVAAVAGAAGAVALALAPFGLVPPRLFFRALGISLFEAPLVALAVLAWPAAAARSGRRPAGAVLDGAVVLTAAGFLFWDFLLRPAGGIPGATPARAALLSWALVMAALALAAVRGSRSEYRAAFGFLVGALATTFAVNYAITVTPHPAPAPAFLGGVTALLLRFGAAEALRRGPSATLPAGNPRYGFDGVFCLGAAAAALLAFHAVVRWTAGAPGPAAVTSPETNAVVQAVGAATVAALLLVRQLALRGMLVRGAAMGTALLHGAFIAFQVAVTAALVLGWMEFRAPFGGVQVVYFFGVVGAAGAHAIHGRCVFTTLENRLRAAAGPNAPYRGSFLEHYLASWPARLVRGLILGLRYAPFVLAPYLVWRVFADLAA